MNRILSIFGILTLLFSCKSTEIKKNSEFEMKDKNVNLNAFIGQKISITEFDPNENNTEIVIDSMTGDTIRRVKYVMDKGFKSKYKVVKNVFNDLETDTIEFIAFDHYGRPEFEKYKNVILYISFNKEKGYYFHQKYQFQKVQKDKNGIWKGINGENIMELFMEKKNGVLKVR